MKSEQKQNSGRAIADATAGSDYLLTEALSYLECAAALLEQFQRDRNVQAWSQDHYCTAPRGVMPLGTTTLKNSGGAQPSAMSIQSVRSRLESVLNCLANIDGPLKSATASEAREADNSERFIDPFDFGGVRH